MSVVSNVHTAVVYDAKKSVPFEGQRLVVTIAKADAKGNYGEHLQQTMCTSVPMLTGDMIVDALNDDIKQCRLLPHFVGFLQAQQNALISARIKAGRKSVTTEELDIDGILSYLDEGSVSDKWDSQRVASWFMDVMAPIVGVALIEKGLPEDELEGMLGKWKDKFANAFGSRAAINVGTAKMLDKALGLVGEEELDSAGKKFKARIDKILGVGVEEALGL